MLWTGGSVDHGSVDQWISERRMYVTQIRLDLLLNTNQISCYKGKWYLRRFDAGTYLFFCKRRGSIHILGLPRHFLWVRLRILWAGLIIR